MELNSQLLLSAFEGQAATVYLKTLNNSNRYANGLDHLSYHNHSTIYPTYIGNNYKTDEIVDIALAGATNMSNGGGSKTVPVSEIPV